MSGLPATGLVALAAPAALAGEAMPTLAELLPVRAGQELAARVLASADGRVELSLAGRVMAARTQLPLVPGQEIALVVDQAADDRIVLRLLPAPPAPVPAGAAPAGTGTAGGGGASGRLTADASAPQMPAAAAKALASEAVAPGAPDLAARAGAAALRTPAEASAFARLARAGLPTSPAAVAGMTVIIEGPPAGRALAMLVADAARAPAAPQPGPAAPAQPPPGAPAPAATPAAPDGPPAAAGAPAPPSPAGPPGSPAPPAPAPAGGQAQAAPPAPAPATGGLQVLAAALADVVARAADDAASGDPQRLARALRALGHGMEARLAAGSVPDAPPARALLLAMAGHPSADPGLARAAERLADGLAAQPLAGPTLTAPAQATGPGAYLQVPLPGGQTAEVRVDPESAGDGQDGRRPRRLAFLLHLSALGPVLVEALTGPSGVDATVRVQAPEARAFCAGRAGDLQDGLERAGTSARVRVEGLRGPAPARLVPPPPTGLVDTSA